MATPNRQWITLNDTTISIASIQSIEMTTEKGEYFFMVWCSNQKVHKVHLHATGGKWLYTVCHDGLEEAKRGGERYEHL
jgi:hypothetical protein